MQCRRRSASRSRSLDSRFRSCLQFGHTQQVSLRRIGSIRCYQSCFGHPSTPRLHHQSPPRTPLHVPSTTGFTPRTTAAVCSGTKGPTFQDGPNVPRALLPRKGPTFSLRVANKYRRNHSSVCCGSRARICQAASSGIEHTSSLVATLSLG